MNTFNMTCEAVEATLPDYLDETLEAWVRSPVDEHLGQCLRCAGLVRDLRHIEREAAALPDLVPVRDLWPDIESRIGTPVVAFTPVPVATAESRPDIGPSGRSANVAPARTRMFPAWMGAAAAALVVLTAGTTYLLTSRAVREPRVDPVAIAPTINGNPLVVQGDRPDDSAGAIIASELNPSEPARAGSPSRIPATRRGPAVTLARSSTEAVYDKEIASLQAIMRWRKAELDPATLAIIDKNLKIIDAAIAQSKAALRRDPASSMLGNQLTHALDKKVELLRTAAMLPSST